VLTLGQLGCSPNYTGIKKPLVAGTRGFLLLCYMKCTGQLIRSGTISALLLVGTAHASYAVPDFSKGASGPFDWVVVVIILLIIIFIGLVFLGAAGVAISATVGEARKLKPTQQARGIFTLAVATAIYFFYSQDNLPPLFSALTVVSAGAGAYCYFPFLKRRWQKNG
jgi:hypothetical protein